MMSIYTKVLDKQEITQKDIVDEHWRLSTKIILTGYGSLTEYERVFCESLDKAFGTRITQTDREYQGIESVLDILREIGGTRTNL